MTSQELRQKYIEFFKSRGHVEIPSASLLPEHDPSVLFTTAGMHPLVPFLLGEKHPAGKRLVNVQKCIRTGDIDEVGDKTHHTFFEMLGHWSLGDYFKKEALEITFEFVTKELGLALEKLAVTVFAGDKNAPRDKETADIWRILGFKNERIKFMPKSDNWWELAGAQSGPCGPCTEMFYWADNSVPVPEKFDPADNRWVEIGNDVLMEYEKTEKGKYLPAKQKNIDNGTGLERLLAVMNNLDGNYRTDLFWPIIEKIEELSGKKYGADENETRSMRIIADHLRAATFIMGDDLGVAPSNVDQGYVVRKLIRRAIRHGKLLDIEKVFCFKIAEVVISLMKDVYPELQKNKEFIVEQMVQEEEKFRKTLEQGLKEFEKMKPKFIPGTEISSSLKSPRSGMAEYGLSGDDLFNLYATYGFPIEVSLEEIKKLYKEFNEEKGVRMAELPKEDEERFISEFHKSLKKHQELSRTAAAGKFKGGLANQSEMAIKYHTATHLLQAALREVLGLQAAIQRGSNITDERLRLDFSYDKKMTEDQIKKVEKMVNDWIDQKFDVTCEDMDLEKARKKAIGIFLLQYSDRVKVYTIGNKRITISREICGGPHVKNTGELGHFRILKEEASSAGVRRIKAVLE